MNKILNQMFPISLYNESLDILEITSESTSSL
jgi:hypothetical protein